MPTLPSSKPSFLFSLAVASFLSLFPALILSFIIPPILNSIPAVVLKAQSMVCPVRYHLDPFSLWSSLCTDGNSNYTSVWWLYNIVQLLSFTGVFVAGDLIVIYLMYRPPLSRRQLAAVKDFLQRSEWQQALQILKQKGKLQSYQAEVFLGELQKNPSDPDPLGDAWQKALDAPPPAAKRRVAKKPAAEAGRDWLPAECPHCGATLDPSEVSWVSAETAKCSFCGGIIKMQPPG